MGLVVGWLFGPLVVGWMVVGWLLGLFVDCWVCLLVLGLLVDYWLVGFFAGWLLLMQIQIKGQIQDFFFFIRVFNIVRFRIVCFFTFS